MDTAPPPGPAKRPAPQKSTPQLFGKPMGGPAVVLLVLLGLAFLTVLFREQTGGSFAISYDQFIHEVEADNVTNVEIIGSTIRGIFKTTPPKERIESPEGTRRFTVEVSQYLVGDGLDSLLLKHNVRTVVKQPTDGTGLLLGVYFLIPLLLMGAFWISMRRARDPLGGSGILGNFTKSPAKRFNTEEKQSTFADVAGLEGVKEDLKEIVEFLKDPKKFQRLGGRVPKGVLLMGPPGTGKTLLARAVAGEAGVPFFSISGSEFIQMFVGVGASRVRDLFKTAKEASPAILFIDEIDAVGRIRGAGLGGGHDEREQTLNQILSEMDGFSPTESVIVLAATNRPDVLDPALLRPGRFDRHVTVDRPNQKARVALFEVHTKNVPLADDIDMKRLAEGTVGLTGADIRNLVNEAALWATRQDKNQVDASDFDHARDKILMGPKREEVLVGQEKKMTAYHEAGHALASWLLPGVDKLHKVTIIPRGRALGVTQLVPEEDRMNIGESDLHNRLAFILAGRSAEKLVFGEFSAGAENDLTQATRLARKMVSNWGMSERVGPLSCQTSNEHPFLGRDVYEQRDFSEHTAQVIDEEVGRILSTAADRADKLLTDNREKLDTLSEELLSREMLDDNEVEAVIGPSVPRRSPATTHENEPA
ncbi:MAG: ATP-dependent zinc metalloprotease FtsH [Pirellulales bacterium]|nr:ATP-dependent zinc metalloprotease FtsH [Pirellulales bacterium]